MSERNIMKRKHTLSEKHPLLSMLLSVVAATFVCMLAGSIRASDFVQYLLISAAGVLCLLAQKWWFAPAFKGVFRAEIPLREIGLLCVPFLIQLVLSWLLNVMDHGLFFHATALSAVKILTVALVTSVVFGLSHLGNARGGNAIGIVQGIVTIGTGLFYAAVFLRTGSIMVTIIMHALYDWMYFVTNPALQNGDMAAMGVTTAVIISSVIDLSMGVVGFWLIRPAVREKIEAVWQKKWLDYALPVETGSAYQGKH